MSDQNQKARRFQKLREKAERMLDAAPPQAAQTTSDVKRLLHELGVLHIELEMQHEDLLSAQRSLEASRNSYIRLYDFAPVGYVVLDRMGLILDCNLAAASLFGAKRHFLVNKPFMTYVRGVSQEAFYKHRTRAFDSSTPQSCELELALRDGRRAVVKVQSLTLPAESGPPSQCLTAIMDITEQKELQEALNEAKRVLSVQVDERSAELLAANEELERSRKDLEKRVQERTGALEDAVDELRESEERLRTLFMTSPDSITLSRMDDGRFTDVNEGFCHLSGYSREEALGQSAVDLNIWPSSEVREAFLVRLREEESLHNVQTTLLRKDATPLQCLLSARRLMLQGVEHMLVVTRDISDLKRAEEKFRSIFLNSNLGIFRSTTEGRMLDVNPALASMLGYDSPEHFMDRVDNARDIYVLPAERDKVLRQLEQNPEGVTAEVDYQRLDGRSITGRLHLRVVYEPHANEPLLEGFVEDISERRRAEEALRRAEERYRLATAAGHTAVWQVDLQTGLVENEGIMERMLGLEQELADLGAWARLLHPDDRRRCEAELQDAIAGHKQSHEMTLRFSHSDGQVRWLSIQGSILRDEDGTPVMATGTTRDVTEQQRMQQELRQAKERADAASEAKSGFLANMSHEIRTPLGSIMGMTDLTLTTPLQEDQRKYVTLIKESATSLLHLINDLLDIAKIEAGKLEISATNFLLEPLLHTCVAQFQGEAIKKSLELKLSLEPGTPAQVCGDPERLAQVLRNLLANALKFTETGEVGLKVKPVSQSTEDCVLLFTVSDTGIGIAGEDQPRLFKSFSQLEQSLSRKAPGTGLGLAICKEIVEKMGGSIWVESRPGQGSRFHFTVSFACSRPTAPPGPPEPQGAASPEGARSPLRILLAEDNPVNAEFISHFLRQSGHEVHHAESGGQALELWQRHSFNLVLMDIQMQGMDGMEATRAIRAAEGQTGAPRTPVVALTAYAMEADKARFMEAGMDDCVTKPVDIDLLLGVVARYAQAADPTAASQPLPAPEPAATEEEREAHFDDERACAMVKGSMDIMQLLRQKFLYEAGPQLLAKLQKSLEQANLEGLREAAHSLKGSSSTVCAPRATRLAQELEQAAMDQDLEQAGRLVQEFEAELQTLQDSVPQV